MEGPPLGPGGGDMTSPDQVAPRGQKVSSTRKNKPQTSTRKLVTHEGGHIMYVAIPYFVFMEAMVSSLINGENIPYVWNPCCLLHLTVSWARVRMGHV